MKPTILCPALVSIDVGRLVVHVRGGSENLFVARIAAFKGNECSLDLLDPMGSTNPPKEMIVHKASENYLPVRKAKAQDAQADDWLFYKDDLCHCTFNGTFRNTKGDYVEVPAKANVYVVEQHPDILIPTEEQEE